MGSRTAIAWTDATWNPVTGCSKLSPGCANCYAEALSLRQGWSEKSWTPEHAAENVVLHPERLDQPFRWRKPRRIFVVSMGDLFHERVPDGFIDQVFIRMALTPWHIYQVLTKRPERLREYMTKPVVWPWAGRVFVDGAPGTDVNFRMRGVLVGLLPNVSPHLLNRAAAWFEQHYPLADETFLPKWPLANVWLGVSVENQHWADERIPLLLETPATVRFVSCEPLLGPVDLTHIFDYDHEISHDALARRRWTSPRDEGGSEYVGLDWVIAGGESGPKQRPMNGDWARSLRDQCVAAGVPFFFKQKGGSRPTSTWSVLDGRRWEEMPAGARERTEAVP